MNRIIGKQFNSIFRVCDMLCLNIGNDIKKEFSGIKTKSRIVSEYSFHVQTQWRFVKDGHIILASGDIYEPYRKDVPDDWDYDIFGRSDEESSIFDVQSKEIAKALNNCTVSDCWRTDSGDLSIVFSDNTIFKAFVFSSHEMEFWRLIDFTTDEHIVIFEE